MATKNKEAPEIFSYYGGAVTIERRKWGESYRYKRMWKGEEGKLIFATHATKNLDKSRALLPWAVDLVCTHITSNINSDMLHKDEIFMLVQEARNKPEEAKVKGGTTGDAIHNFAHDFALATLDKSKPFPSVDHLDPDADDEHRKILNGVNAFLDWYNSNKVEFVAMEKLVYYNSLLAGDTKDGEPVIEYAGYLDLLARVNGQLGVFDYKTGKAIYSDQRYQNSGYYKAYNSDPANERAVFAGILNFGKETGELIKGEYSASEVERDFEYGFKGLYLVTVREKELEAEREALKKEKTI